jgi:type I restriction enzyme S subunit
MFYRETEFQGTEIGEIPKDWNIERLGRLINYVKGKKPKKLYDQKINENSLPYLTAEYMRGLEAPKWCDPKEDPMIKVNSDDVIMIWDGSYAGHVFTGFNGVLASTMIKIVPKYNNLDEKFLYYYLTISSRRLRETTVGTGVPHINKKIFEELYIPLPPLDEQKRIAGVLSMIDGGIESVDRAIAKLERMKKALLNGLLTGRIRVREENGKLTFYKETEFQDTEIGKMPKEWEIKRLGELLVFGHGKRPSELLPKGIIPVFGAGGLYGYTNTYMIDKPYVLILARVGVGSVGKVYLARGRVWVTDNAIYAYSRQTESVTAYVYYWLQFNRKLVEKHVKRSAGGYAILTLASLKNITIALPPQNEQKNIVETLNAVNNIIEIYEKEKERLLRVKKGLMDLLLTGKIRVVDSKIDKSYE